jgi:hypothetical protein
VNRLMDDSISLVNCQEKIVDRLAGSMIGQPLRG